MLGAGGKKNLNNISRSLVEKMATCTYHSIAIGEGGEVHSER
jgi:hypothetical protein